MHCNMCFGSNEFCDPPTLQSRFVVDSRSVVALWWNSSEIRHQITKIAVQLNNVAPSNPKQLYKSF